jgi:uncharacterized protein (DUF362 family)
MQNKGSIAQLIEAEQKAAETVKDAKKSKLKSNLNVRTSPKIEKS